MPKIKPILKLTDAQYERLMERVISREQNAAPVIQREAMMRPGYSRLTGEVADAPIGGQPPGAPSFPMPSHLAGAEDSIRGVGRQTTFQQAAGRDFRDPDALIANEIRAADIVKSGIPGQAGSQIPLDLVMPQPNPRQAALARAIPPSLGKEGPPPGRSWPVPTASRQFGGGSARIPLREEVRYPSAIDDVMNSQPPKTLIMARLQRQKEGVPFSEPAMVEHDLPYLEARMKYLKDPWSEENPGGWKPVNITNPSYKHLRTVKPGVSRGKNMDMGGGLNYSEVKYKSVETPFERRARKLAQEPQEEIKASLPEIVSTATLLERTWQLMGGKRSVAGQMWSKLKEGARGKSRLSDTKDYFISSGLHWRENPEKFARLYPREAKLLTSIWNEMSKQGGKK